MNAQPIPILPRKREPLAQVEVLMLFHPSFQSGGNRAISAMPDRSSQGFMTLDIFGRPGTSELTNLPIIEDMRCEVGGRDIEALLPDSIVNDIAAYVADIT